MQRTTMMWMSATAMALAAGLAASIAPGTPPPNDPFQDLPATLSLTGVVRDFKERGVTGGHPDFELNPSGGFGTFANIVKDELSDDGKPEFRSTGNKINTKWKDSSGRAVIPSKEYISSRSGDVRGSLSRSAGAQVTSSDRFEQWFQDVPGVNLSQPLELTLVRQSGTNTYTFNDRTDSFFAGRGGFFPVNGELFGNSRGDNKNFHFTFELSTEFVYRRGQGQVFTFTGDDDVWVFIDNKLVIDLGGIHGADTQSIELDRLSWLQDGLVYSLKFFFAERHRTQSNFRMDTTINLRTAEMPATSALHD